MITPAGYPDHGLSRQLAEASTINFTGSPEVARQTGAAAGGPLKRLTLELGGKPESAGRRIRRCVLANPVLKIRDGVQTARP